MKELPPKWLARSDQVLQFLRDNFNPEEWCSTLRLVACSEGLDEHQKETVVRLAQAGLLYLMLELDD